MAKLTDKMFNRVIEGDLELNSAEKAQNQADAVSAIEGASSGTISSALGLDNQGKLVKGSISGGTQLYKHIVDIDGDASSLVIISLSPNPLTPESIGTIFMTGNFISGVYFGDGISGIVVYFNYISNAFRVGFYSTEDGSYDTASYSTIVSDTVTPL